MKRITLQLLCLLLLLLSFTGVVHGTETIFDEEFILSDYTAYWAYSFDLPAGDNITIYIVTDGNPIDFNIDNGTDILYERININNLEDVWTVPREDNYVFEYLYAGGDRTVVHTILGSEIIPEFPIWTSMLLVLITLTVAIVIYKRRLLKTPNH